MAKRKYTKKKTTKKQDILILQLETFPAVSVYDEVTMNAGLTRFRKELVKVGRYFKDKTGQAFEVTTDTIDHWIVTFNRWIANGNKVPIPLSHDRAGEPESNQGWVHKLWREDGTLVGLMELSDESLALTTDVSICVQGEVIDGKGQKYIQPITHVALCTDPVIPGLEKFEKLSLSNGDSEMDKGKLAKLLDIAEDASDELIANTIAGLKMPPVKLSQTSTVDPVLVRVVAESRAGKLNTLINAGILAPVLKDVIEAKYIKEDALTLSLSRGGEDGFDLLIKVLTENKATSALLSEKSGVQVLELSNRQNQPSGMAAITDKKRKAAKNRPGYVVPG